MARYNANDKMNPYDPASMLEFESSLQGIAARVEAGTSPVAPKKIETLPDDPSKMAALLDMLKADAAERECTGETPQQQMVREKMEWAAADARSAKIKLEANHAFRKGNYKDALVLYTVCCRLSPHEPLYWLNRAAASLKLGLFEEAIKEATLAIEEDFNLPKAFFRRGQAHRLLGDLDAAEADLSQALFILDAEDAAIAKELEETKALQELTDNEMDEWMDSHPSQTIDGVFGCVFDDLVKARLAQND